MEPNTSQQAHGYDMSVIETATSTHTYKYKYKDKYKLRHSHSQSHSQSHSHRHRHRLKGGEGKGKMREYARLPYVYVVTGKDSSLPPTKNVCCGGTPGGGSVSGG